MSVDPAAATACPVDHKTREAWLEQARNNQSTTTTTTDAPPPPPHPVPNDVPHNLRPALAQSRFSLDHMAFMPIHPSSNSVIPPGKVRRGGLDTFREVSTIPRAVLPGQQEAGTHSPANNEQESGSDEKSGNWIYPSEKMFFDAMKRKNYDPNATDMRSIVPIHNAVNEQAWKEIKKWEEGKGSEACGGPRLVSFSGQSTALTPKARFNSFLGYSKPFDRHDWIVDRCGTQIDYVIDFYAGKNEGKPGKSLNFYLDVRPKLNSWEGIKLRAEKLFN